MNEKRHDYALEIGDFKSNIILSDSELEKISEKSETKHNDKIMSPIRKMVIAFLDLSIPKQINIARGLGIDFFVANLEDSITRVKNFFLKVKEEDKFSELWDALSGENGKLTGPNPYKNK